MNISSISENNECRGCCVCSVICPTRAIEMKLNRQGFYYACIDKSKCINCGRCSNVCCVYNKGDSDQRSKAVYYAYDRNEEHRLSSSSGGAVGVLVKAAIGEGYSIIGAAYDYEINRVKHICVNTIDDYYKKVSGSKYIPSDAVEGFLQIESLDKVLVIGTPCQIKAIMAAYPSKDMICIDFRCYGVCGYTLWDKYIQSIDRKYKGRKISYLNSRSKNCSWLKWGVEINFEDGTTYFKPKTKDDFGRIFSGLAHSGEHCLKCTMSGEASFADIRVEDGWQLSKYLTSNDYKKGASQVTIMSDQGMKLWKLAELNLVSVDVGLEHAVHGCKKHAPMRHLNELIENPHLEIDEIIRRYCKTIPISKRIFDYLCNLLFNLPSVYFAVKRAYRKIKKMDD